MWRMFLGGGSEIRHFFPLSSSPPWALEQGAYPSQTEHSCILFLRRRNASSKACNSDRNKVSYLTEQLANQTNKLKGLNKLTLKKNTT